MTLNHRTNPDRFPDGLLDELKMKKCRLFVLKKKKKIYIYLSFCADSSVSQDVALVMTESDIDDIRN